MNYGVHRLYHKNPIHAKTGYAARYLYFTNPTSQISPRVVLELILRGGSLDDTVSHEKIEVCWLRDFRMEEILDGNFIFFYFPKAKSGQI